MENKRHLNQVESLRAMAAIAVSIFHFSAYFVWNEQATINFTIGAQGVEVFYLISGFIIPYSLYHSSYKVKNYFHYMGKRLVRLLPPYVVTIVLIQLVGIFLCTYLWGCEHDVNFRQIAINIFFLADLFPNYDWINPIFATLEVELQFYILIGLLFPVFRKYKMSFPIICLLLLILGSITTQYDTVLVNSPYFICGMSLFFIKEKNWKLEYVIPILGSFISLLIFYMWQDFGAALIGGILLYYLPSKFKFLNFTGKISYSFYLVHGLAGGWFLFFTSKSDFALNNPWIMIFTAILISWLVALIMYLLIELLSIKISKKIKYKK